MEKGDRIICINNKYLNVISLDKIYIVKEITWGNIEIKDISNRWFNRNNFITLENYFKLEMIKLKEQYV